MRVELRWDEPFTNVVLWEFHGIFGVIDYLPPMNNSIRRAMVEPETRYDMLINLGNAIALPNRPFRYITQALNGAPRNLNLVVCASKNPLTRMFIAQTLGNEASLEDRFFLVSSYEEARAMVEQSRQ